MKKLKLLAVATVFFISCGNNPENTGSSTPIDSTNINGTAPVQYGPDNPAMPDSPRNQGTYDDPVKANTLSHDDSVAKGLIVKP